MFKKDKESFPAKEEKILRFWAENEIFKESIEERRGEAIFSFYDGPPFATGLPHYGHLLAGTIKDVVARYKTMRGFCVPRRFGWDCHGLPVENEIEKEHNLSGASMIEQYGIGKFNEECRKIVLRYTGEWKKTVERMGRWVEFDRVYRTMDLSFMESVWWVFSELWKKDLVYEGFKVMHYSPKLGTPISNFEANLNYRDVDDPSLTVKVKLLDEETYVLVWTTTPWTLPSNLALCVGPDIEYVKVRAKETYILAKARVASYFASEPYEVIETLTGKDLLGKRYEPVFSYFRGHQNAFQVLNHPFVSVEEGTGVVHMAPAFGEDDFEICKTFGITPVCPIDTNCKFTHEVVDFEGQFVKDADKEIIRRLKNENKVFKHGTIRHRYPFCWRTDMPLIYRAVSTWFVAVEKIREEVIASNEEIHWVPGHIKSGRFGKWLENARDWAVSRNRYWGTPLPIWRSEDGDIIVISNIQDLEMRSGKKIEDLHRHYIDDVTFTENGKVYKRVSEVFDCWFESGSMPYAQNHYPFENREETERDFPADFIAEGLDQTRGWFYTLTVLSTALFKKPAFRNVIVNGIVLAEDGQKMSKRLKNYPEPGFVIDKYGADAIRLYLLNSPVVRAEDISFSEKGVDGILKQILLPLWNSYFFLATYAEIYDWIPTKEKPKPETDIDRWILSRMQTLIHDVEKGMDHYNLDKAVEPFVVFIEELTNWYIRRSRTRFWADEDTKDRRDAFETLYYVLLTLAKVTAPFIPFISEVIYQELKQEGDKQSVHLCFFPTVDESMRDSTLEREMSLVQEVVNAGHSLRKEHQIKVRQPLGHAHIVSSDQEVLEALKGQQELIKEELNVKCLSFSLDETDFVRFQPKPNYRILGKKVGRLMNQVKEVIEHLEQKHLKVLFNRQPLEITVEGECISLTEEDILIERQVHEGLIAACTGPITIAIDTHITPLLEDEGIAREVVNKINLMRKTEGLHVTDRITLLIQTTPRIQKAIETFHDYIAGEVLATSITFGPCEDGESLEINQNLTKVVLKRDSTARIV